jgi:hypothetical protein
VVSYPFLLLLDTDKIKDYVFASSKLKEIRGASMLLHYLNTKISRETIYRTLGLPEGFSGDEHERFRIIYLDGGSGKVEFLDKDDAIRCGQAIADAYARWTKTASLSWIVTDIDQGHYYESVAKGEFQLRLKKQAPSPDGQAYQLGVFHRCRHNEMDIVENIDSHFYEVKQVKAAYEALNRLEEEAFAKVGPAAIIKRAFYSHYRQEYEDMSVISRLRRCYSNVRFEFPKQMSVIGEADGSGYIGLVYMDGNSMNTVLRSLSKADSYRRFSRRLKEAIERALVETVMQVYPPDRLPELVNADEDEAEEANGKTTVLPVELVLAAGDDLIVIVPATKAMAFASTFLEKFSRYTTAIVEDQPECLTMSAGIAIAKSSFPIKYLVPFAEQLLKSAKKKNYERRLHREKEWNRLSTLDYMVVTMSSNPDLPTIRQEQLTRTKDRIRYELTVRPFDWTEWKELERIIETMKGSPTPFPHTKIKWLYHVHFMEEWEGEYYFLKCFANLDKCHKKALRDVYRLFAGEQCTSHWYEKEKGVYASPLIDFFEIYPFIEGTSAHQTAAHQEEEHCG